MQKPVYFGEMTFVTENDKSSEMGLYAGIAAQFGFDISGGGGGAFEGDNLIELLKSRRLVETTLLSSTAEKSNVLLIDRYLDNNRMRVGWSKDPVLKNIHFQQNPLLNSRIEDSILLKVYDQIVKRQLDITRVDKKLNLVSLTMKDGAEDFAKEFIEKLTENAISFYVSYKSKKAQQNVLVLQRQTDSVRNMLFGNISEVAAINDLNVNPIRQSVRIGSQRKQVDVQVNAALYGELLKNLELSKLALRKETPLIQIIDTPQYPLRKKKLGRLLGGVIFSFVGTSLMITFLLIQRWYKSQVFKSHT
jgi:hypothetical protein